MPFTDIVKQGSAGADFNDTSTFQIPQPLVLANDQIYSWCEMNPTNTLPITIVKEEFISEDMPMQMLMTNPDDDLSFLTSVQLKPSLRKSASISAYQNSTSSIPHEQHDRDIDLLQRTSFVSSSYPSHYPVHNSISQSSASPPSLTSITTISSIDSLNAEQLCPLLAGQIDTCQPSRCGPNAPCMNFSELPPIEECSSVPCLGEVVHNNSEWKGNFRSVKRNNADQDDPRCPRRRPLTPSSSLLTRLEQSQPESSSISYFSRSQTTQQCQDDVIPSSRGISSARSSKTIQASKTNSVVKVKTKARAKAKKAHSLVERKYRENLNAKIVQLWQLLQSTRASKVCQGSESSSRKVKQGVCNEDDTEVDYEDDKEGNPPSLAVDSSDNILKVKKSDVLVQAMTYIHQTEDQMRQREEELAGMREHLYALEKVINDRAIFF